MAYTVRQVAALSGVSVRTLHFYDETGLLAPARTGANGYRYYEEPQLLMLQQILFYRELGFGLKEIRRILGRADFQKVAALESHREVLEENLARTRRLLETIDATISHLEGGTDMTGAQLFEGFRVAAGDGRFGERVTRGGEPTDCKVSAQDTGGALCVFEFTGRAGWPRHWHHAQDEWLYVVAGEVECEVGAARHRLRAGESVFVPRKAAHAWAARGGGPARVLEVYQPAGRMEQFFREVGRYTDPPLHEALSVDEMVRLFDAHGMCAGGCGVAAEGRGAVSDPRVASGRAGRGVRVGRRAAVRHAARLDDAEPLRRRGLA